MWEEEEEEEGEGGHHQYQAQAKRNRGGPSYAHGIGEHLVGGDLVDHVVARSADHGQVGRLFGGALVGDALQKRVAVPFAHVAGVLRSRDHVVDLKKKKKGKQHLKQGHGRAGRSSTRTARRRVRWGRLGHRVVQGWAFEHRPGTSHRQTKTNPNAILKV